MSSNIYLSFDFFGKSTNLLFQNQTKFKTKLGFCCSILLIILSMIGGFYLLASLFNHSEPAIGISHVKDQSLLNFHDQSFFLGFVLKQPQNDIVSGFFNVQVTSKDKILRNYNLTEISSCGDFQTNSSSIFCLEITSLLANYSLDSIKIIVQSNDKETNFNEFTLFYETILINSNDYYTPIQTVNQEKNVKIVSGFTKTIQFLMEAFEVNSNSNFIFQEKNFSGMRPQIPPNELLSNGSDALFIIELIKSPSKVIFSRSYVKILTALGNLGGLIKMLWLMIFAFINPFVNILYRKNLINQIFNFNDQEFFFKDGKSNSERESTVHDAIFKLNRFVRFFKRRTEGKEKKLKSLKSAQNEAKIDSPTKTLINDVFKVKETSLDLSIFESLMYYACNYKTLQMKKELIRRGSRAINKRIDVTYILQKIVEIEKLKVLLLDEDQLKLFEYLPKPILTNNKNEKLFSKKVFLNKVQAHNQAATSQNYFQEKWKQLDENLTTKNNILEKVTTLYDSYQKVKYKDELTEIDQKLLEMLDENIKGLLEKTEKSPSIRQKITEFYSKTNSKVTNFKMLLTLFTDKRTCSDEKSRKNSKHNSSSASSSKKTSSQNTTKDPFIFTRAPKPEKANIDKGINRAGLSRSMQDQKTIGLESECNGPKFLSLQESRFQSQKSEDVEKHMNKENKIRGKEEGKVTDKILLSSARPDIKREVLRLNSKQFRFLPSIEETSV